MKNAGLFSTLFLESVRKDIACADDAQGRLVTLGQSWQRRDAGGSETLWSSFIKAALGNLGFVVRDQPESRGLYPLFEDFGFKNGIAMLYLVEPGANLDDESVGRFWPAKLITALRQRKLNWGILTDGATWRLYSTKSAKPYEDHVELDLGAALQASDETAYALFERFFHAESFVPVERDDYETEKVKRLKAFGLKAKKQKRASSDGEDDDAGSAESNEAKEREAGIYLCRLDLDGELSEAILEAWVKEPLLAQVDNVLRYICNGFIADTPRTGSAYTEEERREVFESSVKLLYRCLFLFYAEARRLLPSEDRHADIYKPHSIQALCREARKFRWNERSDTDGYDLWQQLKGLVQAVNEGDPSYGVMGYNGGLFDDQEEKFLGKHRLRNDFLANALYWLAFVDPAETGRDEEYPIPYEDLEVRHLGEMYEAILEYKVRLADTDYIRRRTKTGWQTLPATGQRAQEGDIRIKAGDIFFGETALERKQSGSYYTPESLVRFLVGKAVIAPLRERWENGYRERFDAYLEQARTGYDDAAKRGAVRSAEERVHEFVKREVLPYKVCDPAMGSGHFLVAGSNLMADFVVGLLAQIESIPGVPSGNTGAPNHWRRLITRHCLYGVDLNPLAVNLAKLALWLNCFARDHKLTFLDHHLRCGNSLIGLRDLDSLRQIPGRRKDTKREREVAEAAQKELPLSLSETLDLKLGEAAKAVASIVQIAEDDTDRQRNAFEEASAELQNAFAPIADLYTSYLMDSSIRSEEYARLLSHFADGNLPKDIDPGLSATWKQVRALRGRHNFLHWPLEFPDVFATKRGGGFSATVGNPPWDAIKPNTREFYTQFYSPFAENDEKQASELAGILNDNPVIYEKWKDYESYCFQQSAYFTEPETQYLMGKGDINTYKLFLSQFFMTLRLNGWMGILVPSGLYMDEGCKPLRECFFHRSRVESMFCFENRWPQVFPAVDDRFKFVTFATQKGGETGAFRCAFMQHDPARLPAIERDAASVTVSAVKRLAPSTFVVLEYSDARSVDISTRAFDHFPPLSAHLDGAWQFKAAREFDVSGGRRLFNSSSRGWPIYEGKMISHFDHLFAHARFWINSETAKREESQTLWRQMLKRKQEPITFDCCNYRVAYRRVARSTDVRSFISTLLPRNVVCTDKCVVVRRFGPSSNSGEPVELITSDQSHFLCSVFCSLVFDFLVRLRITTQLDLHIVSTLPVPRLGCGDSDDAIFFWPVVARALRLICTTDEYAALWAEVFPLIPAATLDALRAAPAAYGPAHEQALRQRLAESYTTLDATWTPTCGLHDRKPDRRDDGDRAQTRAELDALIARLYGLTCDEFAYILDTFPVLRNKEKKAFGEFQSKRKALEEFERFAQ